jgi:hypothetical protein
MDDAETTPQASDLRSGIRDYVWFAIGLLFLIFLVALKASI